MGTHIKELLGLRAQTGGPRNVRKKLPSLGGEARGREEGGWGGTGFVGIAAFAAALSLRGAVQRRSEAPEERRKKT